MRGFTLLELLIVLAITAILLSLAYPVYISHEARVQRLRAIEALQQAAAQLEIYFEERGSYKNAALNPSVTDETVYRLVLLSADEEQFVVAAMPQGVQVKRDRACGALI